MESDGQVVVVACTKTFMVEMPVTRVLEDLWDNDTTDNGKVDDGHAGQSDVVVQTVDIVGNIQKCAEKGQPGALMSENGNPAFMRSLGDVVVGHAVVTVALREQKLVHGGLHQRHANGIAGVGQGRMGVPVVPQPADLGRIDERAGSGMVKAPCVAVVFGCDSVVAENESFIHKGKHGGLQLEDFAGGLGSEPCAVGRRNIDLVQAVDRQSSSDGFGLAFSQRSQRVGIVDGIAVANVVEKHDDLPSFVFLYYNTQTRKCKDKNGFRRQGKCRSGKFPTKIFGNPLTSLTHCAIIRTIE